MGQLVRM